ncbi:MAG: Vacuolar protein sorting-associated protein 35 [Vezdaea aestivalis]|nr:MAG: Vacuolar protein sorting-associated protein 35 [Vezdaea aestivalis]
MSSPTPPEDQARLLDDAITVVRQQSTLMRRCLESKGKLMDALKCSSTLVSELRVSNLGPKQYYELYMAVFDALRILSDYLKESHPHNHLADLYELVQYAGNIVPRLYLMVTVGTAYMTIKDAPVKEIMKDMMEMSRGIQHPIRGLFLRYYLSGQVKETLPRGDGDGPEGNLNDSIGFTLTNFVEMNKLWVRLQHQGHSREREQRTRERQQLQLLVGNNLERLSQLVDLQSYQKTILGPLLEQVVQCRDVLAQEYLLEVIIQVFPDEYHLHTLNAFLAATARLNPMVNVKAIIIGLMDRLSAHSQREAKPKSGDEKSKGEDEALVKFLEDLKIAESTAAASKTVVPGEGADQNGQPKEQAPASADGPKPNEEAATNGSATAAAEKPLFEIFFTQVTHLAESRLPIQDIVALLVSLVNLALNVNPDNLEYVNRILGYAKDKSIHFTNSTDLHGQAAQRSLLELLLAPVKSYHSIFTALSLPNYLPLLHAQQYQIRRAVAVEIAKALLDKRTVISKVEDLSNILEVLKVLIQEGASPSAGYNTIQSQRRNVETEETIEEQAKLAKIVHLIQSPENATQLELLQAVRKAYAVGNERLKVTLPPLVTACIKLAHSLKAKEHFDDNWSSQSNTLYKMMHRMIHESYEVNPDAFADLCLRLNLICGQAADQAGFEEYSYEFFAEAFSIYEVNISDSRAQYQAVCIVISALHGTRTFGRENYDTLITKCALHGSKLLKKPDQCRAVCAASHLWWAVADPSKGEDEGKELYRDGKRVLECLQRALRVADACMDQAVSVELFVEILNQYVYYFDQQNEAVTIKYLNGLIELINSNLSSNRDNNAIDSPRRHFERTKEYMRTRDYAGLVLDPK